ncbi:MAG: hemerythrin family protein [Alphaproteobacteria bacterium]|nr:hemerythrin family protein [Alphaproteobacteria bacterium]
MLSSWNANLSIGVASIDADHQLLFRLVDDLQNAISEHEENSVISSVLYSLAAYTDYHFAREERIMAVCGYPDLAAHHGYHEDIRDQVRADCAAFQADPIDFDVQHLTDFLKKWLTLHIMGEDTKLKPYVAANVDKVAEIGEMPLIDLDGIEKDAMDEEWQWPI